MLNWTWWHNITWGDRSQFEHSFLYYDGQGGLVGRFDERFPPTSKTPVPMPIKSPPTVPQISGWQSQIPMHIERWEIIPY